MSFFLIAKSIEDLCRDSLIRSWEKRENSDPPKGSLKAYADRISVKSITDKLKSEIRCSSEKGAFIINHLKKVKKGDVSNLKTIYQKRELSLFSGLGDKRQK